MKNLPRLFLFSLLFISTASKAQNVCSQQFSNVHVAADGDIDNGDAEAIVNDIVNVMGLKSNFEIKAAKIPNAAAVVYNGRRYVLYNPAFIAALNKTTGNDWASVSVLAHEIGHHLNGHTLSAAGSDPAKELDADEFSGYVMQRLGATLEEAETAMKLAADIQGTTTHPGRTARLTAIEQGWSRASDQLTADIEANENDSSITPVVVSEHKQASKKSPPALLDDENIAADIAFTEDANGQYFLTVDGKLVAIKDERLFLLGQLKEHNSNEYPYIIENNNTLLYIDTAGTILDESGASVGRVRKHG